MNKQHSVFDIVNQIIFVQQWCYFKKRVKISLIFKYTYYANVIKFSNTTNVF